MARGRWTKRISLLVVLTGVFPLLAGCWDRLELEERAVVLGVAVDKADPSELNQEEAVTHKRNVDPAPDVDQLRVSVQIALPGKIPLGPGEGGGGGKPEESVWVVSVTGHTIDDALMNLQQQISSRLFYGHLRVIVVSEALAREGLTNLNDFLRRNPEVRRMAWMLISKGKAEEIIRAKPPLERVPTMYLISTLDNAVRMGKFPQAFIGMFWSHSSKKGQEGILPYVKLKNVQNMELTGLAVFRGDRMVGSTEATEIGAYMSIKKMNPGGYRVVVPVDGTALTIYATHRDSRTKVRIKNGKPHISVTVEIEANLEEKSNEKLAVSNGDILNMIEKHDERTATPFYENLVKKTQRWGTDIFGFGELVRAKKPAYWNRHVKNKEKWQQTYRTLDVDFKLVVNIRRVGMKAH